MTTNNNNCVGCGCNDSVPQPCAPAPPVCATPQPCTEILDAQCVKYTGPAITCNDVNIIPQNTSVADALNAVVDLVCDGNCCAIPAVTNIEDPNFILLCRDEIQTCPYNGLLYNWYAINNATAGDGRVSGGIVNVNPVDNPINTWRVPNDADWYSLALALDPTATNIPWNNAAGGKIKSTLCWSLPNSGATNSSALAVAPSVYRNPSGTFSNNNGQIGLYWSASQVLSTTASGYSAIYIDDSIIKNTYAKGHGLRLRLVRPIDCTEFNGDFIPNAYKDNDGNQYNAKVIGTLVWLTEDLRDTGFNNGANIPATALDSAWAATTTGAYCLPDNRSNYESNYTVGCEQVKISFQNFLDAIPTGSGKAVDVVRNWGTCVTTEEVTTPEEKTIYSVAIEDSGWQDLEGFDFYEDAMALRKPQVRRVGTVLHFRGDIIIPLGVQETLIPVVDSTLYSKVYRKTPYQTIDAVNFGKGVYIGEENKIYFNCTSTYEGGGTVEPVIPTSVLPANINLDNNYRSSNVIGLRKITYIGENFRNGEVSIELPPDEKAKESAKITGGDVSVNIVEPTSDLSSVLLSTYAHVEILANKQLRITPLETLEVDYLNDNIYLEGNSKLRNIVTNYTQGDIMLSMLNFEPTLYGLMTEQSASIDSYIDASSGFFFTPGSMFVVVDGDTTACDFSNISDIPANSPFTTIYITSTGYPNTFGNLTLVDIRNYQVRPRQYQSGLGVSYKWPRFIDSSGEDTRFDAARAKDMGGFVFNLDNLQAFTDIDNCYSTCENTPEPAQENCCTSPLVYYVQSALQIVEQSGGDINNPESIRGAFRLLSGTGGIRLPKENSTLCCQNCGFVENDNELTVQNPYILTVAQQFGAFVKSVNNSDDLSCCFNISATTSTQQELSEDIGPALYNSLLCVEEKAFFETCVIELLSVMGTIASTEDIPKAGLVEYNNFGLDSQICALKEYLVSVYGTNPPLDDDGYNIIDYVVFSLIELGVAIVCTQDEIIMCDIKTYTGTVLNAYTPA